MLATDVSEIVVRLDEHARVFSGKTVLISGGMGFLGRYFVTVLAELNERVLAEPCKIIVLDNLITAGEAGKRFSQNSHCTFHEHDAREKFDYAERLDYIIQTAGIASPYYYRAYPLETLEVATVGTKHLLDLCREKGAKYCFFSSSEIYGDPTPEHVPTPESYRGNVACQGPRACYDESKRLGETLCYVYHHTLGVAMNCIRPFNVYGPGMQESDYRVLPNFASRIKGNRSLNVYGSGLQTRTYCYITDAMVGFFLTLICGVNGETYNIGTAGPELSVSDLVKRLGDVVGRRLEVNLIEHPDSYPADEPTRRCPDIRKARLQLGYAPQVELEEGLARFLRWTNASYTGQV